MQAETVRYRNGLGEQRTVSGGECFNVVYEELKNKHCLYVFEGVIHSSAMLFQAVHRRSNVDSTYFKSFFENREDYIYAPLERFENGCYCNDC